MHRRVRLFSMEIDAVSMPQAVAAVLRFVEEPAAYCQYVVTPNVDHVVLYQESAELRAAYAKASLVLADGHPVVWASRLLGRRLPGRVAGSDLVPALFDAAQSHPIKVFLLGAGPGVAERARTTIERRWKGVTVVGTDSPPKGFERDPALCAAICDRVNAARPDVLIVGLGAPKQELWVHAHRLKLRVPSALCVGAVIDFLAGEKTRAPAWIQKIGLEWFHRLASEPRRLASRYFKDARAYPRIVAREWLGRRATG
jgi:N-acetylglucosaminyldiphosphoundecaprenol N-acetyl-beta-D-mannosaminyltransferase